MNFRTEDLPQVVSFDVATHNIDVIVNKVLYSVYDREAQVLGFAFEGADPLMIKMTQEQFDQFRQVYSVIGEVMDITEDE